MRKVFLSILLVVLTAIPVMAEGVDIILRFHKNHTEKDIPKEVNRAPMRLPVYVSYDTETGIIDVRGSESLDGEVYLYDADGVVKGYSPTINTSFEVASNGFFIIYRGRRMVCRRRDRDVVCYFLCLYWNVVKPLYTLSGIYL